MQPVFLFYKSSWLYNYLKIYVFYTRKLKFTNISPLYLLINSNKIYAIYIQFLKKRGQWVFSSRSKIPRPYIKPCVSLAEQTKKKKKVKLAKKKYRKKQGRKEITRMEFSQFQVGERSNAEMPVGGRVAGKVGIYSSHYNGNVNRDIIPLCITRTYNSPCTLFALIYLGSKGK